MVCLLVAVLSRPLGDGAFLVGAVVVAVRLARRAAEHRPHGRPTSATRLMSADDEPRDAAPVLTASSRRPLSTPSSTGLALLAGLLVGAVTNVLQGVLPDALQAVSNSGSVWSAAALDEDPDGGDELYARVRLYDNRTSTRTFTSGVLSSPFGPN